MLRTIAARTARARISRSFVSAATYTTATRTTVPFPHVSQIAITSSRLSVTTPTRSFSSTSGALAPSLGSEVSAGDADFETILAEAGDTPVVVDFYANWCGPCRVLAPILKKAVEENKKTFLVKVDVDKAEQIAAKYQIMSLPTVLVFQNSKVKDSFIGSRDEAAVKKFIEKATQA
ncbi:thioredoxin [Spizellomyces punctatus DAOM BR117]|uniref:Thioredoxin n=1 Tax=Spizellomyces punctatus (strain DAOM BR117) TaxID=645134 RepID=A0A0L0H4V2_SPIPD|nr:thioredoxin [Spizellomyces punctatus DAOM BR117]KNC95941.1 thioredoxin [Spizellomyces punctatus DAOM BR117]|eukprot:XP_016603981.1 thioredoxin [Spizellomyces punctatus DAOM BR117]